MLKVAMFTVVLLVIVTAVTFYVRPRACHDSEPFVWRPRIPLRFSEPQAGSAGTYDVALVFGRLGW